MVRSDVERCRKPVAPGVYVGWHLSLGGSGKASLRTEAKVANRTQTIRPSGMKRGACGNVGQGSRTEAHGESRDDGSYGAGKIVEKVTYRLAQRV